jgi:hypothetical protein
MAATPAAVVAPSAAFEVSRRTFAPALPAQVEMLKAIERFGRYHYSVAGDYLEWGMAQARVSLAVGTPVEQFARQSELSAQFGQKLQGRAREFLNLASETRATFQELVGEATARSAKMIKQTA